MIDNPKSSANNSLQIALKGNYLKRYLFERIPLTTSLAQIGGFLALFKIGSVIYYYHMNTFEKKLKKKFEKTVRSVTAESNNDESELDRDRRINMS